MGKKGTGACMTLTPSHLLRVFSLPLDPPVSQHNTCSSLVVASRFLHLDRTQIPQARPRPFAAPRDTIRCGGGDEDGHRA